MNELYKIAFDTIAHIINKWNDDEEAEQTDYEYLAEIENCVEAVGELPDNVTNGDVIKAMFPNVQVVDTGIHRITVIFGDCHNMMYRNSYDEDWWNAPYQGGQE